jgi:hypothetical protein
MLSALDKLPVAEYEKVRDRAMDTVFISGGAHLALGRLEFAYPKANKPLPKGFAVPTRGEVELAFEGCGFPKTVDKIAWEELRINKTSSNGYPFLGTGQDEDKLHAAAMLGRELHRLASEHVAERGTIEEWMDVVKTSYPHLVVLMGKAKADVYTLKKVEKFMLRFYNVVPRQFAMLMQTVTQPFEGSQRNVLEQRAAQGEFLHSAQGVPLAHCGAEDMVEQMEIQLAVLGYAYVHCGDDTWLVFNDGEGVVCVGLDASNFDLTQRGEVIAPLRERLTDTLRTGDRVAAEIWNEFMRSRVVAVAHTLVREMNHGGPSGMMMQSKLNDMLAHVMCDRYVRAVRTSDPLTEEEYERLAISVGDTLGLVIRLEMFVRVGGARTIREVLREHPFLFLGYYFHEKNGRVVVMADMPRSLAGIRYPGTKWEVKASDLAIKEPMRIGSIVQSWGIPTKDYEEFFGVARGNAVRQVEKALSHLQRAGESDYVDDSLRWALDLAFVGEATPSMRGLLAALQRNSEELWLERKRGFTPTEIGLVLGDLAKGGARMRRLVAANYPLATGPSRFNDGRPAPVKRWIPEEEWRSLLARKRGWVAEGRTLRINKSRKGAGGYEFEVDEVEYSRWDSDSDDGAYDHRIVEADDEFLDEFGDVQVPDDYYDRGDLGGYERVGRYRI